MNFFKELRRRNIFRLAGLYAVVGWLLAQAALVLETAIALPAWFDAFVVTILLLGFPITLVFAWAFEITPEGLKRTEEVPADESIAARTGRKLDYAVLVGFALVVMVFAADRLMPERAPEVAVAAEAADAPPEKSLAVLPFVDLSPNGDQEYFADGLSEELLNVLAGTPELKVAGRTSSFAFKGQNRDLRDIGAALGVANILEGSVRKAGNRIRVTAQLVKASDGFHLFSESYDGDLDDIFAVQDDIAGKIAAALKTELMGEAPAAAAAPAEFEAYDLYLLARQKIYSRDPEQLREARDLLDRALALDPDYAPALAQKAIATLLLSDSFATHGDMPAAKAQEAAQKAIDRALAVDPDLAEAHAALGLLRLQRGAPLEEIAAPLRRALDRNPNLMDARNWLALALLYSGKLSEAHAIYGNAVARDPLYRPAFINLINDYVLVRELAKADALIARAERILGGPSSATLYARGYVALARGSLAEAVTRSRAANEKWPSGFVNFVYTEALVALGDLETALKVASTPQRKASILSLMRRENDALAAIEAIPPPSYGEPEILRAVTYVHVSAGRHEATADYVARHFGDARKAGAAQPLLAPWWAGTLARAYRELGRSSEFAEAFAVLEEGLRLQRAGGADYAYYWQGMAELAILNGDKDLALDHLKTAIEKGLVSAYGFYSPVFDDLRDNPRFIALEAEMRKRANAERAKLGLARI